MGDVYFTYSRRAWRCVHPVRHVSPAAVWTSSVIVSKQYFSHLFPHKCSYDTVYERCLEQQISVVIDFCSARQGGRQGLKNMGGIYFKQRYL